MPKSRDIVVSILNVQIINLYVHVIVAGISISSSLIPIIFTKLANLTTVLMAANKLRSVGYVLYTVYYSVS